MTHLTVTEALRGQRRCLAFIDGHCSGRTHRVRLRTIADRPDATAHYCDAHGGRAEALRVARRDWMLLAPPAVGRAAEVVEAGCDALQSEDLYVVVRPEGSHWLAWIGIGSHLIAVPVPGTAHLPPMPRKRPGRAGRRHYRSHAFRCREAAVAAASAARAEHCSARVSQIKAARGGTLDWGLPVDPAAASCVLVLGEHGSAWDAISGGPDGARIGGAP